MSREEIDSVAKLNAWLASGPSRSSAVFQQLDLTNYEPRLLDIPLRGCSFIGCTLSPRLMNAVLTAGCLVYSENTNFLFRQFRNTLYSPAELFAGFDPRAPHSYKATLDWQIYLTYADPQKKRPRDSSLDEILARRIHDFSISDAVEEMIEPRKERAVAIMGGHDCPRSHPAYRCVAVLAYMLTNSDYLVVSGGGPGVMEAANLGAFFAPGSIEDMDAAIETLRHADSYTDPHWLARAWEVREAALGKGLSPGSSLGIPTWFYGHEPPNVFATDIAKYFENSFREEGLLALGLGGVIFAEGNAGTVQEIFQDACQNYYRTYGGATAGFLSPMVLLDSNYWNANPSNAVPKAKPLFPLLQALAREKRFEDYLLLTDPPSDKVIADKVIVQVLEFIKKHPPIERFL